MLCEPQAWDDSSWVLAVMHYPNDPQMRESYREIRSAQLAKSITPAILHRAADGMSEALPRTAQRASTAGDVLAILWALDQSPWFGNTESSMDKAVWCVRRMRQEHENWRDVPAGNTEIRKRVAEYRAVWHLWAAWRLIRDEPDRPARCDRDMDDLLGTAQTLQSWALAWHPTHGNLNAALLDGSIAYLIPETIPPRSLQWGNQPPRWLAETLSTYSPRVR